ncbi:MAG: radical SAM protein [Sodaliphilus sp.]|uniref:PqqD family peptide modification chaperone n=1 Tax=Sodaliphilus pleomorphus TaxID=2606626 RepID=UPI0023F2731E|nr:PqqD family peptide modification chaperone [Sodaliphilus pleomorphus]MDD7066261.1 radical SAM protein [Sodaliphilus pleomorphus]MDY4406223.1 radical SAM protein [Sodaliphilus sp.]MDY5405809.1 radical SAM protein [Sodaliphilus sp.]
MLIRQSKNSFIRIYDNGILGYITNQLTRHDRTYIESGADFLSQITREPKDIESIVADLTKIYDADIETIRTDFMDLAQDLAYHKFVVVGETTDELDAQDLEFSYAMENPKTLAEDFTQITGENPDRTTQDYLMQHDIKKPRLACLQFELTSRCNERCIHCYIPNGKKNTGFDLTFDRFKHILDQFAEMGGINVTLSGGEALMNKDIEKILRYCREKDLQISLLTNLISLNDEHVKVLKEVNVSLVQVSLYSMTPEVHDMITTVKGSFERTKSAIEKLYDADVPVQISCPVMKANKEGYDKVIQYAQSMRMKSNTDYIMMAQADLDTSNLANRLSIEETEKVVRNIMDFDKDYKEQTLLQEPISSVPIEELCQMPLCGAGINDLCITVNGDIYPCAGWQSFVVGNVFKQSLKDIWENSPKLAEIRKVKRKDFPKCLTCEARDYCAMCLVRNYNESGGDMFKVNKHFCDVAFLTKRIVEEYKSKGLI